MLRCRLVLCLSVDGSGGFSRNVLVGGCGFFDVCDVWEGHFGVSIDGGTACGYLRVVFRCKIFWHFSVLFSATTQNILTFFTILKKEIPRALQVVPSHFRHPRMSLEEPRRGPRPCAGDSPLPRVLPQKREIRG